MSRRRGMIFAVTIALAVVSTVVLSQDPEEAPKPGPEHEKLGYFVGKWTGEGEMQPNPFMPGGKFTTRETCEWFEGRFVVVCHTEGNGPMGLTKGLGILGYNTEEQAYTYYGIDSGPMTMASVALGNVAGKTWTYTDEAKMDGKMVKSRFVIEETSSTSYLFRWDMVGEDGAWMTLMEGKATKVS